MVMVAVPEFTLPAPLAIRTQKLAVLVSAGVTKDDSVAPGTGEPVSPLTPEYHWIARGAEPATPTLSVAVWPEAIV